MDELLASMLDAVISSSENEAARCRVDPQYDDRTGEKIAREVLAAGRNNAMCLAHRFREVLGTPKAHQL